MLGGGVALFAGSRLGDQALAAAAPVLAVAVLCLLAAVAGWWAAGAWVAQLLLAAVYVVDVMARGGEAETSAPAVAAALLLSGELAALSRALLDGAIATSRELGRRLAALGALGLAAVALGWLLLAVDAVPLPGGILTTLAGVAAAIAALALAVRRPT